MPFSEGLFDNFLDHIVQAILDQFHHGLELGLRVSGPAIEGVSFAKTSSAFSFNSLEKPDITC
jgi:hypothetical protein